MSGAGVITWGAQAVVVDCRVCGRSAPGTLVASLDDMFGHPITVRECAACASVEILDVPAPSSSTDESVDLYIEAAAGIGTIAKLLTIIDPARVRRAADIGCGYGFGLDLGRHLFGWDVVGMEPSLAGERGRDELELPIHIDYFTGETDLGGSLDLIMSSEVLEHIPDPVPFLVAIREHLAPQGAAVFTTPAREVITPHEDHMQAFTALSPGYHCFVASEGGLRLLLSRAGFTHTRVWREQGTLFAVAGMSCAAIEQGGDATVSAAQLESWYRARADAAPEGSMLAVGLRGRLFRSLVSRGDFVAADAMLPQLHDALRSRSSLDFRKPAEVRIQLADARAPMAVTGLAHSLGMRELLHTGNAPLAADYFGLSQDAAANFLRYFGYQDMEIVDLELKSAFHEALALARFAPERITERVGSFLAGIRYSAPMACRVFVELAVRGHATWDSELTQFVESVAAEVVASASDSDRRAGLDALYMLAVVAELSGDAALTVEHVGETLRGCLAAGLTSHTVDLIRHCLVALERLNFDGVLPWQVQRASDGRLLLDVVTQARESANRVTHASPLPETVGAIDLFWRDATGMFIEGWVHAGHMPVASARLRVGETEAVVDRHDRPDLRLAFPLLPEGQLSGFSAYLPVHAGQMLELTLETAFGSLAWSTPIPATSLPRSTDSAAETERNEALVAAHIAAAPAGKVLAIGLRTDDPDGLAQVMSRFGDREVVTLDIHPGLGVDVVGDAHQLSTLFEPETFAVVYSNSVLEHVSHPWVIALETSRVLIPGGVAVNWVPWTWPTHAQPNDFWRMSPQGLELLYGPELGYEILESGGAMEVSVVPGPQSRLTNLRMPTTPSNAMSWVAVRKIGEPHPSASWPFDAQRGEAIAQAYPEAGLASRGRA
jgi:2-polyprenyl-3-methyl-5-hydroxy-6-metoxy-1,4-benzoquinol methylase